ncbi:DUF3325 domain-containing protein [Halarcobacter anaerophilus]|uniref:DUF3325 domain-containing protein n=1 Tax=Halarcobacter anaerophilus TaxID=877500 RepID=A0A4Q0XYV7_9BACT|nr:DUF3325 domain-containing protein [Halarcobacter anaerophilus]QDF28087.1 DUF3325 domain-containing membrane protein [Halarcobacter anaerophilus]RXJ62433.1 hypothetical protein CRV06_09850 [Halarcobacter anaerophilus]
MLINISLIYLGLSLLCLGMDKHYKAVFQKNISRVFKNFSKFTGSLLLIISLIFLIKSIGISLGITYWIGILTPEIIFIALILTYKTKMFIPLSIFLLLLFFILNFL